MVDGSLPLVFDFIQNNGFAIVVALFSLIRLEKTIKANTEAIEGMRDAVAFCKFKNQ